MDAHSGDGGIAHLRVYARPGKPLQLNAAPAEFRSNGDEVWRRRAFVPNFAPELGA